MKNKLNPKCAKNLTFKTRDSKSDREKIKSLQNIGIGNFLNGTLVTKQYQQLISRFS